MMPTIIPKGQFEFNILDNIKKLNNLVNLDKLKSDWNKQNQLRTIQQIKQNQQVQRNKIHDINIANQSSYGWKTSNSTQGGFSRRRLARNVDPSSRLDPDGVGANLLPWIFNYGAWGDRQMNSTKAEDAIWKRHLGFPRDQKYMPVNGIRFKGDYNSNGTLRLPNAEYTGIPQDAKNTIRQDIINGDIKVNKDGNWTPVKENIRYNRSTTSQYANFSIRENNGSGIYDIFDTYDFPNKWYQPNLNRPKGYQIEVRDTIWGPNANPKYYNMNFTKKK